MLITQMTLENYRAFSDKQVYSPAPGYNLIIGGNGEGKSTIQKAHRLLFFGETQVNLEEEIHPNKKSFEITATFTHNGLDGFASLKASKVGKTIQTERELRLGSELWKNSDALNHLKNLFDPVIGGASSYYRQSEPSVITATKAGRRDLLKAVYRLEFDEEIATVDADLKKYNDELQQIKGKYEELNAKTFEFSELLEYPITREEYADIKLQLDALGERKKSLVEELAVLNNRLVQIQQAAAKRESLIRQQAEIEASLGVIPDRIAELAVTQRAQEDKINNQISSTSDKIAELQKELDSIVVVRVVAFDQSGFDTFNLAYQTTVRDLEGLSEKETSYQTEIRHIETALSTQKIALAELEDKLASVFQGYSEDALHTAKTDLSLILIKRAEVASKLKHILEQKNKLNSGTCPTCGKPFSQHDSLSLVEEIAAEEAILVDLDSKKTSLVTQISVLEEKAQAGEQIHHNIVDARQQVAMLEDRKSRMPQIDFSAEKTRLTATLVTLEGEKKTWLEKKTAYTKAMLDKDQALERRTQLSSQINELNLVLQSAQARLEQSKIEYDSKLAIITQDKKHQEETLKSVTETLAAGLGLESTEDIVTKIATASVEQSTISNLINESTQKVQAYDSVTQKNEWIKKQNKDILEQKEAHGARLESVAKEIADTARKGEELAKIKTILSKELPTYILTQVVQEMQRNMNEFIETVYHKPLHVKMQEARTGVEMLYSIDGKELGVAQSSGAEEQILTLAYKNSLSQMVNLGYMWCDEVDAHLMDDQAVKLQEILIEMSKGFYEQVFQISHVEPVKDQALLSGASLVEVKRGAILSVN